jgi:WD40 repeat protein
MVCLKLLIFYSLFSKITDKTVQQTSTIVIGDENGDISIYNSSSLSLITSFKGHSSTILRIKQSPFNKTSNYVATCSIDDTVKIWDSWTLFRTYSEHPSVVNDIEWLDADFVASSGLYGTIRIWSASSGETNRTISTTGGDVQSLKLLKNQIHLAVGYGYPYFKIEIYNINDGSLVATLQGHTSNVFDMLQINESNLLISSGGLFDNTVRIWNLTTNVCKFTLSEHTKGVLALKQITPEIVASASEDSTIKLWNIANGTLIRTLTGHTGPIVHSLDLMKNGHKLVSGGYEDESIKVWDWSTGEVLSTIQTYSRIYSLAVVIGVDQQQPLPQTTTRASIITLIYS